MPLFSQTVTELKGFGTCVLFKNEMLSVGSFICLLQIKEMGIHIQSSVSSEGGFAIAYIHYLVNNMLVSSLQLVEFPIKLIRLLVGLQNTVRHFNNWQE